MAVLSRRPRQRLPPGTGRFIVNFSNKVGAYEQSGHLAAWRQMLGEEGGEEIWVNAAADRAGRVSTIPHIHDPELPSHHEEHHRQITEVLATGAADPYSLPVATAGQLIIRLNATLGGHLWCCHEQPIHGLFDPNPNSTVNRELLAQHDRLHAEDD